LEGAERKGSRTRLQTLKTFQSPSTQEGNRDVNHLEWGRRVRDRCSTCAGENGEISLRMLLKRLSGNQVRIFQTTMHPEGGGGSGKLGAVHVGKEEEPWQEVSRDSRE